MTNETSPRPWRLEDGFECEIVDATGRHVLTSTSKYAVPPLGDEREAANARLIVDAVNERDLIAARLEAFDKKLEEAVAIHDALCAERDRLRDIVRKLVNLAANLLSLYETNYHDEPSREFVAVQRALLREARAAIGEDAP